MLEIYKSQFEETKQTLKDVEENIKRITGRDPDEYAITSTGNIKLKSDGKFGINNSFQRKRPFTNRFGRQAEEEQEDWREEAEEEVVTDDSPDEGGGLVKKKPSLQSTVVATKRDMKSRKATMEEQKSDSRGLARNRRMFGFVLGTLQKFQKEESRHKALADKRAEIDKKLEEAADKEREQMKKEKEQMFVMRREKQTLMRCLEKKMDIAKIHGVWEKNHKLLVNFIQTEAEPVIMFVPAKHNDKSKKKLEESQEKIVATVKAQRTKIDLELNEIDRWYTRDNKNEVDDTGGKESKLPDKSELQPSLNQAQTIKIEVSEEASVVDNEKQTVSEDDTHANGPTVNANNEDMDQTESLVKENGIQEDFEPIYDDD